MHSVACARFDYYKKEPVNCGVLPYKPPEVIVAYLGITAWILTLILVFNPQIQWKLSLYGNYEPSKLNWQEWLTIS